MIHSIAKKIGKTSVYLNQSILFLLLYLLETFCPLYSLLWVIVFFLYCNFTIFYRRQLHVLSAVLLCFLLRNESQMAITLIEMSLLSNRVDRQFSRGWIKCHDSSEKGSR